MIYVFISILLQKNRLKEQRLQNLIFTIPLEHLKNARKVYRRFVDNGEMTFIDAMRPVEEVFDTIVGIMEGELR
jgi:thymidylate kinase